jgi:hypothetical protein
MIMNNTQARCAGIFVLMLSCLTLAQPSVGTTEILSPKAGESYKIGDTVFFHWVIHSPWMTTGTLVQVSLNEGFTWYRASIDMIKVDSVHYRDTVGTFYWKVPDSLTSGEFPTIASPGSALIQISHPYNSEILTGDAGPITILPASAAMHHSRNTEYHQLRVIQWQGFGLRKSPVAFPEIFSINGSLLRARSYAAPDMLPKTVPSAYIIRNGNN